MKIFILCALSTFFACGHYEIYSMKEKRIIEKQEFLAQSPDAANYILGEYHYDGKIQKIQSEIIKEVVNYHQKQEQFSVGWEFLLYENQQVIDENFQKVRNGIMTAKDFLDLMFPKSQANNNAYAPIIEQTASLSGELIGLNASRKLKSIITKDGIAALDAKLIPPNFQLGSENYFTRFEKAMGGHVGEDKLQKYYEAQCYTDSVMANYQSILSSFYLRFTIVGSFHNDYGDGFAYESTRYSDIPVVNMKVINASKMSENEIQAMLQTHKEYGDIADYVLIAR